MSRYQLVGDHLVGNLYEAAISADGFLAALQTITESLGANIFHMFSWDALRNAPLLAAYTPDTGLDWVVDLYDQYYGALDPRRAFVERDGAGKFVFCQDYLSDADVARSEFFQDFHIPTGFRYLTGARFPRFSRFSPPMRPISWSA